MKEMNERYIQCFLFGSNCVDVACVCTPKANSEYYALKEIEEVQI